MNSRMKLMLAGCTVVAASVSYAFQARAGYVSNEQLIVEPAEMFFEGAIGNTRYSADNVSYISCTITTLANSNVGHCSALEASRGKSASCVTTNANLINAIRNINSISYVYVRYDSNGNCARIDVTHSSQYLAR